MEHLPYRVFTKKELESLPIKMMSIDELAELFSKFESFEHITREVIETWDNGSYIGVFKGHRLYLKKYRKCEFNMGYSCNHKTQSGKEVIYSNVRLPKTLQKKGGYYL